MAVYAPFFDRLSHITGQTPAEGSAVLSRSRLQIILTWLAWGLILSALAGPQWVQDPIEKIESGRDLMLAVDLSGSMQTEDFTGPEDEKMSRIDAVKWVLDDFIRRRQGDRLGLVIFGNAAYLQSPFSLDHDVVRELLEQVQLGMAGVKTMLGDSIGLCIQVFEKS
ncbi:MAG: VWA domain-containing protein, partial [Planctomycetota bacterium]